jgi:hypothetical protein
VGIVETAEMWAAQRRAKLYFVSFSKLYMVVCAA